MSRAEQIFGIDLRSLIAFRIGLAVLLLADLVYRALDFRAHYTDEGVLPRALYLDIYSNVEIAWSFHLILGSTPYIALLFCTAGVAALALLCGRHTRWAVLFSWLLLVSLHNRQPLVISGSDLILRLLLFWSIFLPLAGPPSLDRRQTVSIQPRIELSPASVALLLQVALIYAFSLIHKLMNPAWTQLTAIQDSMRVEGVATALGRELLAYPELLRVATASTLAIEFVLPLLAFFPWATARIRIGVVIAMVSFHLLGVGGTMNLGLFEYVMALAWVPFLPPLFWDRVAPGWGLQGSGVSPDRGLRAGIARGVLVVFAFSLVVVDNVASLDRSRFRSAPWTILLIPTKALALSQEWRLWSTPLRNRYYVFHACLKDDTEVDLHTGEALDWDRPRRTSRNNHWWKYQLSVSQPAIRKLRPAYAKFLIREWNSEHAAARHVASLELVKIDASRANDLYDINSSILAEDEPISTLPREILWRVGPRPSSCSLRHEPGLDAPDGAVSPSG